MTETTEVCENPAFYRYTWPGRGESFICQEHVGKLQAVASAISLPLQIIPLNVLSGADLPACSQRVSRS